MNDLRQKAEEIYETKRHYPPSNKIWERWGFKMACHCKPNGITHAEYTINRIQELLESGHKVKYGWCAASMIRTVREYYIFYKKC